MSNSTQAGQPMLLNSSVSRSVRRLRAMGALIVLCMVVLALAGAVAVVVRLVRPVAGTMAAALVAAGVAVAALAAGAAALEALGRRARKAGSMEAAIGAYSTGCVIAALANLAAGAFTIGMIVTYGLGRGLWIPALLVLGLNVLGLVMAMPKMSHLRELHYRPTLPGVRV